MKLHNNSRSFNLLISLISDYYNINPAFIEKDYFVTLLLQELSQKVPGLVFKGGTSLSKCYKIINRFSEDIDLTLDFAHCTQMYKKQMKKEIIRACETLSLNLINEDEIKSRRDYNCYKIEYPIKYTLTSIKPIILVETSYITNTYPTEIKEVSSFMYEYLREIGNHEAIEEYKLAPFNICVQTLSRTFVDKVFALCDYYVCGRIEMNSRHIYDIAKLLKHIKLDENMVKLISKVRNERKTINHCYSTHEDMDVQEIIIDIVKSNIYRKDYEYITKIMLYKNTSYEEAISALITIIESGIFKKENSISSK